MDAAADAIHTIADNPYPTPPPCASRPLSWRMWLSARVGAAEAALATVFVGGAALAASPTRRTTSDEALPALNDSSELSLADAWAAVRGAVAAAMAAFEDEKTEDELGDKKKQTDEMLRECCTDKKNITGEHDTTTALPGSRVPIVHGRKEYLENHEEDNDSVALREKSMSDITFEETDFSASFLRDEDEDEQTLSDGRSDGDEMFKSRQVNEADVSSPKKRSALDERLLGECYVNNDGGMADMKADAEATERLSRLRQRFDDMFAQNGGAECVARVKQIGDDALIGMRDAAEMDSKMLAELDDAKLILDNCLQRLDASVRSKVNENNPEYEDAAAAAKAVIAESKENARPAVIVGDGSRLLAVFATRICAAALECLEATEGGTWSERVERMAGIATVGVSQLRTVSFVFAEALTAGSCSSEPLLDSRTVWPPEIERLNDVAISHVLQCVALAIAALQVEAAERAHLCSAQC